MAAPPFAPLHLYEPACRIVNRLRSAGHEAYIAGGAVRDFLLGRPQSDLDIATSAHPSEVKALFRRTVSVGESFGVVIVQEDGRPFEVATFREDLDYQDGRHPGSVRYSTARADVQRRDFTINGMLWDPATEEVLDWVGGQADVQARLVRTIGSPELRFGEDRLRMLRALRFACQLGFTIEAETWRAIRERAADLAPISTERIRDELAKLLASPGWHAGLGLLHASGMEPIIRQRLVQEWGLMHKGRRPPTLSGVLGAGIPEGPAPEATAAWMQLILPALLGMPRYATASLTVGTALQGLEASAATDLPGTLRGLAMALRLATREARELEEGCQVLLRLPELRDLRLADRIRLLRHPGLALARQLVPCFWPDGLKGLDEFIERERQRLASQLVARPLLDGNRLLALGVPGGPGLGAMLHELETRQLEGELQSPEQAEALVQDWLRGKA
jgi:hypothetical protein